MREWGGLTKREQTNFTLRVLLIFSCIVGFLGGYFSAGCIMLTKRDKVELKKYKMPIKEPYIPEQRPRK